MAAPKKKKGSVLELMDNIRKTNRKRSTQNKVEYQKQLNDRKKSSGGLSYNHSLTKSLYNKTKDEFDIDIPSYEMPDNYYKKDVEEAQRKEEAEKKRKNKW